MTASMPIKVKELMENDRAGRPSAGGEAGEPLEMWTWHMTQIVGAPRVGWVWQNFHQLFVHI